MSSCFADLYKLISIFFFFSIYSTVSHLYGFGLMDAEAMVIEAEKWTTVPAQHICVENTDRQIK